MCSINHNKKAIFIHIPKNGGSYVADILEKYYGFKSYYLHRPDHDLFCGLYDKSVDKHENKVHGTLIYYKTSEYLNNIMKMNEEKWDTYFIFTFLRNPYDRIISGWNYVNKFNIPFDKYLNIGLNANSYDYWHVFMPQARHLVGNSGKVNISYYGKFENMENDLNKILKKIGVNYIIHVPYIKNEKKHKNYKTYYDQDALNKVNEIMKEDFELLNFTKIENIDDFMKK